MHNDTSSPVSLRTAFWYWLRLGFISFGGPAGQIAIMHTDLVERRRWISERRFLHALNYCMLLPGPEATQLAVYIGWLMHGTLGGIIAGTLFVLPSLLLLIALSWIYMVFGDVPVVAGFLYGVKPAVTAIVLHAAWRIGSRTLNNALLWCIALAAFVAIFFYAVPFPVIVLSAAVIGFIGGRVSPRHFQGAAPVSAAAAAVTPALIADDVRLPHTHYRLRKTLAYGIGGLVLWLAGMALLAASSDTTLRDIAWFFSKAALLTFGGAYAVLPYVFDNAVEHYGWLTASQMIDGLALGETTPGPLIMIVAFIGFVGGWTKAVFGPEALFLAGAAGAVVATYFTFLPSFLFILIGGPLVESTHGDLRFTAPLTGVTAAVVGVILNLALFFAYHVLWPRAEGDLSGGLEWSAALIGMLALAALTRFRAGMILVIIVSGLLGLVYQLVL